MGSAATVQRQLVDTKLGGNLDGLVAGLRLGGWGWRKIAVEVTKRSGVDVSHETLRNWFPAEPSAPDAAVPV
jgi:hypothetical protein